MATAGERIDQGYVAIGADGAEVRLRRRGSRRFLTTKSGAGLVREELEVELTPEQYEVLWPATEGRRVEKTRRVLDAGDGLAIELDEYAGTLAGLFTAEVEFPDPASAVRFAAPGWFDRDVTDEEAYRNQRLAVRGLPDKEKAG
jgi:CYTH domain-containing protein